MSNLTTSQADRLGERLKQGSASESDPQLLDEYRPSVGPAYETLVNAIRRQARSATTGRRAKTTTAIIAKLRREHVRLSQIQDIAGCRIVVAATAEQERALAALVVALPNARVQDRRKEPLTDTARFMSSLFLNGKAVGDPGTLEVAVSVAGDLGAPLRPARSWAKVRQRSRTGG